ncbi:hypothetical protein CONPUDRAFT_154464 [Coniophora puteana RWD-64-598 SS2]|uniref:Uncharacterized protein n=1 Tax=Coniophora puteana (strain RWD-64-598) TaxID=741705 RepID=A0A5M3MMV3_CONPW|nr:uncharacterized protein CONPUDRAFT_154464 [Coniophora puteana RWD-64-598 SS2]EIW80433.1 hypothetical protein CONPUDRAFT_154464 [Coniophora puteana RWD-64-598 SS2]
MVMPGVISVTLEQSLEHEVSQQPSWLVGALSVAAPIQHQLLVDGEYLGTTIRFSPLPLASSHASTKLRSVVECHTVTVSRLQAFWAGPFLVVDGDVASGTLNTCLLAKPGMLGIYSTPSLTRLRNAPRHVAAVSSLPNPSSSHAALFSRAILALRGLGDVLHESFSCTPILHLRALVSFYICWISVP